MMNSFANTGLHPEILVPYFQTFFGLFTLVGFVLLTYWAMHNLSKNHLRSVAITILGVGLVGLLVSAWLSIAMPRGQASGANCPMLRQLNAKGLQLPAITPPVLPSVSR